MAIAKLDCASTSFKGGCCIIQAERRTWWMVVDVRVVTETSFGRHKQRRKWRNVHQVVSRLQFWRWWPLSFKMTISVVTAYPISSAAKTGVKDSSIKDDGTHRIYHVYVEASSMRWPWETRLPKNRVSNNNNKMRWKVEECSFWQRWRPSIMMKIHPLYCL